MPTLDEVTDKSAQEVVHKMQSDDEYAQAVVGALADTDDLAEKMLDDMGLTAKVTDQLLDGDDALVSKVAGELEARNLSLESQRDSGEYTREKAMRDFQLIATATKHGEEPEKIAKAAGVEVSKTLQETDATNAGLLIPEPLLDEIIPILTASSVFMEAGPVVLELDQNKIGIGRQNQDPTALWGDENEDITESDADFDKLQLDGKKLRVLMSISNDFLRRDAVVSAEDFLAERMMVVLMNKLETAFFRGTGGDYEPVGITNRANSDNINGSSGNTLSDIIGDAKQARIKLEENDVPEQRRCWFMRKDVFVDLAFDEDADADDFPFREEMVENGTWFGDPIYQTNNIDLDGSDQSNIYYCEMSEHYVGRGTDFVMDTSEHQNFTTDETLMKVIGHFDFELKHDRGAAVIEDYTRQA
jgi:HK97 family phage major capsid protein